MARTAATLHEVMAPTLEAVAREISRRGIKPGAAQGARAALRVQHMDGVQRVVQVYWTPFQAAISGPVTALHLEVADPRPHWGECYLSPTERCWAFFFAEREDGEVQLVYYFQADDPQTAVRGFFDHAGWHVLTATDKTWGDVAYEIEDDVPWDKAYETKASTSMAPAMDEALKKSTIMWMRWDHDGRTYTMPVWFLYDNKAGKIYVVSGERNQDLPGARRMRECDVILRWKGKNAAVAEVPANVRVIAGTDPDWTEIADKVAEKRLNIPGLPEDTAERWREECVILELTLLA